MRDRLENAEEHQSDADAGGEQHREPTRVAVAGCCFGTAESHPAERRDRNAQTKQYDDIRRNHEEPVERRRNPDAHAGKRARRLIEKEERAKHECDYQRCGHDEDRVVYIQAEDLDILLTDFVFDVLRMRCVRQFVVHISFLVVAGSIGYRSSSGPSAAFSGSR